MSIKLTIDGLNNAICNKPTNVNVWILQAYKSKKETRTLKQFYTAIMFAFANFNN